MKEKLKIAYTVLIWAGCALVLFQLLGNYLTLCAFRSDFRTKCWKSAYERAIRAPFDFHVRR